MRKTVAILVTLLIAAVLIISGSAVATWYYAQTVYLDYQCTDPEEALYDDDGVHATIGQNDPERLGEIILNLSYGNEMGASQNFTVYASSVVAEEYSVVVAEDPELTTSAYCGNGYDTADEVFTTPSTPTSGWLYIQIVGISGDKTMLADQIYGPEIDAVGWED